MQFLYELYKLTEFLILLVLIVSTIILLILIIKLKSKKEKNKRIVILLVSSALVIYLLVFACSHKTYFKYNDWVIIGSNIVRVREKYGEFDIGIIKHGKSGKVAYYIYTDDSPIMPDHLPHYYYICYDEDGIVYRVYESGPIGG